MNKRNSRRLAFSNDLQRSVVVVKDLPVASIVYLVYI